MSLPDAPLAVLVETVYPQVFQAHKSNISKSLPGDSTFKSVKLGPAKGLCNSRSSDSGKSSSCSPVLLDSSFDSGIAGVLLDGNGITQLRKRIQQCQCILLALERDQEYFLSIRNRLSKISNRKQKEANEKELFCNVCCAEINTKDEKTYVGCYICKKYICRNGKCSDLLPKTDKWECELCQTSKESMAQTSSWVADQITFNQEKLICPPRARSEIYIPISEYNDSLMHFESVSQIGANSNTITAEQKFKIREYVEEVVAKLLGGNLDTIAVNQLSKSENYLPDPEPKSFQNGTSHDSVAVRANGRDFSNISETRLRQMIEKVIAETMSLPPLKNGHAVSEIALDRPSRLTSDNRILSNNGYNQRHRTEHYFEPTIYQDLLATAVLNKIVGKQFNTPQDIPESTIDDEINDNIRLVSCDQNFNAEKLSTSSGSSVEPRSDCSYPEVDQARNNNDDKSSELPPNSDRESIMSDYLANHMIPLPDLNAITTESEEDDYTSVTSSAIGDGTWEKNWLFKKKKSALTTSATSSSVGMLVPDPKEDIRAQIGDKTADEVSDLSELGSDSDDSLNSLRSHLEPINDRLINKHLIGGQNSKMILDELIECSSMISNTLPTDAEEALYTDARNENIIDATTKTEAINDNINQQRSATEQTGASTHQVVHDELNSNSLTGSIAEREYKKWYNAVEMPNNPYAPEALKRRISGSQERCIDIPNISPTKDLNPLDLMNKPNLDADESVKVENDYKRYSRDYYINSSLTTPQTSPARDVSPPTAEDKREARRTPPAPTVKSSDNDLYKALPAQIIEGNSFAMESMPPSSTSDDSDTIKVIESVKQQNSNASFKDQKVDEREQGTINERESEQKASTLCANRSESVGNVISNTRGSTPIAFKFLQPKRRLLEPNQILAAEEEGPQVTSIQLEKPVIEAEVVKALPSVKALARAFLMTTNSTQPEKLWLRKARTLSHGKKRPPSPKRSLDLIRSERKRHEDDLTITSDLSSLETDSGSLGITVQPTSDSMTPNSPSTEGNASPVPVRQGVLKNNIAFFENLKNK